MVDCVVFLQSKPYHIGKVTRSNLTAIWFGAILLRVIKNGLCIRINCLSVVIKIKCADSTGLFLSLKIVAGEKTTKRT